MEKWSSLGRDLQDFTIAVTKGQTVVCRQWWSYGVDHRKQSTAGQNWTGIRQILARSGDSYTRERVSI